MAGPLEGIRIFDLTHAGVGPWATMILAAMGANVIKIETPAGDTIRQMKPRYQDLAAVYMHCNLGKRGVYLDLKSAEGRETAHRLLADADIFAENMKWGTVARLGLSYADVAAINPHIVYGNFPGWGSVGPYSDRGSADPTAQAFGGPTAITGKRGGPGELIRWYALHDFNASSYAVTSLLLGLLNRERNGNGVHIECAQLAATIAIQTSRIAEFLASGENVEPLGSATATVVPERAFQCQDGRWLTVAAVTDTQWKGLCRALGAADLLQDSRFATNADRVANRDALEERLAAIIRALPARWWIIQLRKHHVPASLFYDYETIPDLPQVKANNYIVQLNYPRAGKLSFGNIPFQFSRTPVVLRPGPWPGQDTEQVKREGWAKPGPAPAKGYFGPTAPAEKGVLDGVTVVDLTQGLCGPYASLLLAEAGATVIKVEPPEGDYARQFGPPWIDGVSAVFTHLNRNKEGVRADLRNPDDRSRLRELMLSADIVIEEEGQARLRRLGLGHDDLAREKPGLITCTITPFGTRGPLRDQPASELVLQAMSDFLNTLGVAGEEPVRMGPDMASLGAGLFVTHGVLGALYHKWRTGEGQHVTVSMLGAMLHQRGVTWTSMVDPDEWAGFYNDGYYKPPDYGYRTADQPVNLSAVRNPDNFRPLLEALGMTEYLDDPLFQHSPRDILGGGGPGHLVERARPIWETYFRRWKAEELLELFEKYGANGAPINTYQQLFAHPQTQALDLIKPMEHPSLGSMDVLTAPWKLYGLPTAAPRPYAVRNAGEPAAQGSAQELAESAAAAGP